MPEDYPKIEMYNNSELEVEDWIGIIDTLATNNPNVFLIFYGGEPFLYDGLTELIKHCHSKNIAYTIISNNTEAIQPKILQLYKDVGPITGFSASIDPELHLYLSGSDQLSNDHAVLKSISGYKNLVELKKNNMALDVVAEITVTSKNYMHLYKTIKVLSQAGIYSSVTTIDLKKSNYYDFSTITDKSLLVQPNAEVAKEFMDIMADDSLLVHIPQLLVKLYSILPDTMKCQIPKKITNITIDSDGSIRLCLRIRGTHIPDLIFFNCINSNGEITEEFKKYITEDYNKYCVGCNWTCALMSDFFSNSVVVH
jgi:MoaA/NifB/PqqE/SkfB family radical SAM enzyme